MISSYSDLIQASHSQQEPQRLLFVFCRAELPDEASPEERAAFERGEGGALTPVICVDKTPEEAPDFGALQEESRATGQSWDVVFVAAMSGRVCSISASIPSATVPTANEMKAALTGEATASASRALVGA